MNVRSVGAFVSVHIHRSTAGPPPAYARRDISPRGRPYRGTLRSKALDTVALMRGLGGMGRVRGPGQAFSCREVFERLP
jgi:hypothetical protein